MHHRLASHNDLNDLKLVWKLVLSRLQTSSGRLSGRGRSAGARGLCTAIGVEGIGDYNCGNDIQARVRTKHHPSFDDLSMQRDCWSEDNVEGTWLPGQWCTAAKLLTICERAQTSESVPRKI